MQMKACLNSLGKGQVESAYLFYGEEEYLKEQALGQLRKLLLMPGMEMMDEHVVEGQSLPLKEYGHLVDTPPFMSPRRLVVVKDDPRFGSGVKTNKEDKAAVAELQGHFTDMSTLVFYVHGTISASQAWLKLLDGPLEAVNFAPVTAAEAAPWIKRMARQAGVELTAGTAEYLFEYAGGLLKPVESEMAKLAAYCQGKPAERSDVEAICVQAVEHKVFAMMDDLLAGRSGKALAVYHALVEDGEEPMRLLALLASQVRVLARAGDVLRSGMSSAEAAKVLGTREFVVKKALNRSNASERFAQALTWCADADIAVKSGLMQDAAAVETLVMRLALGNAR